MEKTPTLFHHIIVNDKLEKAYDEFIDSISDELKDYQANHINGSVANDTNNNGK